MRLKEGFIVRELAGKHTVVPMSGESKEFHGMIQLNDTGAFLWEKLTEGCTRDALLSAVLEEYDVEKEKAEADVEKFLSIIEQAGLLCE